MFNKNFIIKCTQKAIGLKFPTLMMLSYVTYYNIHVAQALVLLRVTVKYLKHLDFSLLFGNVERKKKIENENLPLIKNGSSLL